MMIALGASAGEVELYLDEQGRKELVQLLTELEVPRDRNSFEHFHLFSSEWGNGQLSTLNDVVCKKLSLERVHHFKVTMLPSNENLLED